MRGLSMEFCSAKGSNEGVARECELVNMCVKAGLYIILCGVNRLGNSGVHTLGDTSAFVNLAG